MTDRAKAAELIVELGSDQLLMGRHGRAILRFRQAIQVDPLCADAYAWLGKAYRELGRWRDAERALQKALQLRPDSILARFNLGLLYVAAGKHDRALEQYRLLRATNPVRAERLLERIKMNHDKEKPTTPGDQESAGEGMRDDSSDKIEPTAEDQGQEPTAQHGHGGPRRFNPNLVDTVADVYEVQRPGEAVSPREPPRTDSEPKPAAVETPSRRTAQEQALTDEQGTPTHSTKDPARHREAIEQLRKRVESDPRDPEAFWQLAHAYLEAKDYGSATEAIEQAIANRVDFAGSHPESVRESVRMCLALGKCYERLARFEDAARIYEQALDIEPENTEATYRMGLVMLVLNNRRCAVRCFRDLEHVAPEKASHLLKRLLRVLEK